MPLIFVLIAMYVFHIAVYVFEALGDPAHISDPTVVAAMGDVSFYQMCYFVFITISTVGYGDYSPRTVLGRAATVVIILAGVAFFSVSTAELLAISSSEASGMGRFHPRRRGGHVLVAGGAVAAGGATIADLLGEIVSPKPGAATPQVVALSPVEPSAAMRALLRAAGGVRKHTTLLVGSLLEARDLARCRADAAVAAFLVSDLAADDPVAEDEATVLAAAALHRAFPQLPLRVLLCRSASTPLARSAGLALHALAAADEVAPSLLALSASTPGATTLAANLLRHAPLRSPSSHRPAWAGEYLHGALFWVQGAIVGGALDGTRLTAAASLLFASSGVAIVAVQHTGVLVLAGSPGCVLGAGDVAFVVAADAASASAALRSPPDADWRPLFHARREEAAKAAAAEARVALRDARAAAAAALLHAPLPQPPQPQPQQAQGGASPRQNGGGGSGSGGGGGGGGSGGASPAFSTPLSTSRLAGHVLLLSDGGGGGGGGWAGAAAALRVLGDPFRAPLRVVFASHAPPPVGFGAGCAAPIRTVRLPPGGGGAACDLAGGPPFWCAALFCIRIPFFSLFLFHL